ncbi:MULTISPECIES: membrane lipoprotein lipid attachment site-containing protein [Stenotrophomonas]|jgi:hypothetical protein|uniref:membrane lipoprotein lipid attachment site-containing protein n=1 Tax=Stenotrophomonas TaxID=40323 RepID=UPI000872657F|nr:MULTISPECIES: membrane lipoprotein lipid attachment site-containing protein [Stenotrophomonas]OEZ00071.1 hypothetical protein BIY45_13540 [Stenotrophomonas sp. BIIR7]
MKRIFAPALLMLALSACSSMPNLPDMRANAAWQGRPVGEAIDQFGAPYRIDPVAEKQWVVLVYYRSTSYVRREALGTYTGPQNGQLVHVESWGDVKYDSRCEIHVAVNRARQVAHISTEGGYCGSVDIAPKKQG